MNIKQIYRDKKKDNVVDLQLFSYELLEIKSLLIEAVMSQNTSYNQKCQGVEYVEKLKQILAKSNPIWKSLEKLRK